MRNAFYELLKIKNESNSTLINFNSFPLIKRIFSSRVNFARISDLKKCTKTQIIWVISNLIRIKNIPVWIYWTYNRICVLDINAHNDQGCLGIKPAILFSAVELNQRALTNCPRRPKVSRNSGKYIDWWSNDIVTLQKIMNER